MAALMVWRMIELERRLFKSYILLLLYAAALIAAVLKFDALFAFLGKLVGIFSPLFIGIALAFILNGPFEIIKRALGTIFKKSKSGKAANVVSALLAHILLLLVLSAMFYYIVPQFIDSVKQFSSNYPTYRSEIDGLIKAVSDYFKIDTLDLTRFDEFIGQLPSKLSTLLTGYIPKVFTITTSVIGSLVDLVLGFILSIYLLSDKKGIELMLKRLLKAYVPKAASRIEEIASITVSTFKKFIYGQATEAIVLGLMCFVGMLAFGFPYALPISIIIGVSNLIPIAGPIIGTIPSALILLLVSPTDALWFVVFVVVLQQIEGNIIYPRVVGQSIGLPPLWLLLTIIVGGGLFDRRLGAKQ
jgi:predicted PurR-regulated permease PerM